MGSPVNAPARPTPPDLAGLLQSRGVIDTDSLARLETLRASAPQRLGKLLVDTGLLSWEQILALCADASGLPLWDGEGEAFPDENFPEGFLEYNRIVPVRRDNGETWLVIDDPEDDGLIDMLQRLYPDYRVALCPPHKLNPALARIGASNDDDGNAAATISLDDIGHLKDLALEAPIIRLVNDMINAGVEIHASDIHLEPGKQGIELRYRVDGVLHTRPAPSREDFPAVASRIKILASLDIAERRLPQDGRIRLRTGGRDIDIRVSTLPTPHGEDIVMRLLDQKQQALSLASTGLSPRITEAYRRNLERSNGLILVTGPTGSGKSTTLYSALTGIIDGTRKIITVEDPVEYEIPGISQIQVNDAAGLGFATILRSILRHDPDVIFIGEIRDRETADIAVQASLTGHLVLSTIHTNSATGAIGRFLDMGVADYLLSSSLIAISAQRLVRTLCPACKAPALPEPGAVERFGLDPQQPLYHAVGCPACGRTGYRGRIPIAELLEMNTELRQQILHDPSTGALDAAARKAAFKTLVEDGIDRVVAGDTTLEEVLRVAG